MVPDVKMTFCLQSWRSFAAAFLNQGPHRPHITIEALTGLNVISGSIIWAKTMLYICSKPIWLSGVHIHKIRTQGVHKPKKKGREPLLYSKMRHDNLIVSLLSYLIKVRNEFMKVLERVLYEYWKSFNL